MPRYYFDVCETLTDRKRDNDGLTLDSVEAARVEAIEVLSEIIRHLLPSGDHMVVAIVMRDEAGNPVFKASLPVFKASLTLTIEPIE